MRGRHHLGKDLSNMKRYFTVSRVATLVGTSLLLLGPGPSLAKQFEVTNTKDSGEGSLRRAIEDANEVGGDDEIIFRIPGAGVRTIAVLSELPALTETVTIDGTTQPGHADRPLIRIDGTKAGGGEDVEVAGLRLGAFASSVRGLNITHFDVGVSLEGDGSHLITQCFIGTDPTGHVAHGNGVGISIRSSYNIIGGADEDRNLISGNDTDGIIVEDGVEANAIYGNWIGTDVGARAPLGNGTSGIDIAGALDTDVDENVIAGNGGQGVFIWKEASGTTLYANSIGTDSTGEIPLGNGEAGVFILGASDTQVGDVEDGDGNLIAYNAGSGVVISGSTSQRNTVRGNWSSSNHGSSRGLDLGADGITANDTWDVDTGPNTLQNTPNVHSAVNNATSTTIIVEMDSTRGKTFTIDLYVSPRCSLYPEAELEKTWLGSTSVKTDSNSGNGRVTFLTGSALPRDAGVTAVATDAAGNTSEYSLCKTVL